jgi:NADPH:quinone reductase
MTDFGGPSVLRWQDLPVPEVGAREILVRVLATSVNPVDLDICTTGAGFGVEPPAILGHDASGVIEEVGDEVEDLEAGMEVFYAPAIDGFGAFAEYHAVDASIVALKPARLTHHEAAALPLCGCTAIQALLDRTGVEPGESVLIHGTGGVGSLAAQLARAAGAQVFTVGPGSMKGRLEALGVDRALDYRADDFVEVLRAETGGRGVDVVLDTVGGETLVSSIPVLARAGRMVTIVPTCAGAIGPATARNATLELCLMQRDGETMERLATLVERGLVQPVIADVAPLEDVATALDKIGRGGVGGKIVLTLS